MSSSSSSSMSPSSTTFLSPTTGGRLLTFPEVRLAGMHGHSRLGRPSSTGSRTPSPVSSPRSSYRAARGFKGEAALSLDRVVYWVAAAALRRRGVLLLVPLLYLTLMVTLVGRWDLEAVPVRVGVAILRRAPAGSVYRSPQVFEKLWPSMQADVNRSNALMTAWHHKSAQKWRPCLQKKLSQSELPPSNGFLIIEANGGLNQQRLSICDAVAVARILNATLVIPIFHLNSVWQDSSKFSDIFDEDYFIDTLRQHVRIVKKLPDDVLQQFDYNISSIINMRTRAMSSKSYYLQKVLPKLLELGAVRIAPFSNRLAHSVPPTIQGLRCLSNYEALRFSQPMRDLAAVMVERMDMVAFSCCTYDGGQKEKDEMDKARERGWRGKFNRPGRVISPETNRREGKCPLTPLEVGMMLRGMGFDNTTSVYVASGKIYNAERYMAPLRQLFPRLETKDTLASAEELAPFMGYSSRLAALDYTVCLHSEVFITTQGGNFPHFLMGHRRYLFEGHARTIKPDKRRLVLSFDNPNIRWERFKHNMQEILHHSDVKAFGLRKPDSSVYTYPVPNCMCQESES